jgi:hypothetical protein
MPHETHVAKSQRRHASEHGKNSEWRAKQAVKKKHGMHRRYRAVPTQFKATQLVVAIAMWANAISARGAHPNQSILLMNQNNVILLLDNNALILLGNIMYNGCYLLKRKERK